MRFNLLIKNKNGKPWKEDFIQNISEDQIEAYGKRIVKNFNATIKPGENKRKYVGYELLDDEIDYKHVWDKSCLVTQTDRSGCHDIYKCTRCGVTGKRRGLDSSVRIDNKYKAKKYLDCKWKSEQGSN